MRKADEFLLAQIREGLLADFPDDQWKLVEEEVEKAGGVREVGGYTGVLLRDAIAKASFGGDRSAAGRYAAEQRWKGHEKDGGGGRAAGAAGSAGAAGKIGSGTKVDVATAKKMMRDYDAMEEKARRSEIDLGDPQDYAISTFRRKYGVNAMDVNDIAEGLAAPNSITLPSATNSKADVQSEKGGDTQRETRSLNDDDFADKKAFTNRKESETYKKVVESNIKEIERKDGVPRYKGSGIDLKSAKRALDIEEDMLQSFENKTATTRRLLGGNFKRSDARAIIQARVASAEARVQALEEFDDRTTPGYNAD